MNLVAGADGRAIAQLSTDELRRELARALEVTARHLTHIAAIWKELEARGEDMSRLRSGLWAYIPLIATGKLNAELVVRYAGHTTLLQRLSKLTDVEQQRVLDDDTVDFIEAANGDFTERKVRLTLLNAPQLDQVLSDRILDPEEQKKGAIALARKEKRRHRPTVIRIAQDETGRLDNAKPVSLSVSMTDDEKEALYRLAQENGVTVGRLVRAALIAPGLLKGSIE